MDSGGTGSATSDEHPDMDLLASLRPSLAAWWKARFGTSSTEGMFTPPQREAIPAVRGGEDVLIAAPTGSGKTLASFTAVIDDLLEREATEGLENSVYCLYISPLKSLANDIHRNLDAPLSGVNDQRRNEGKEPLELRHAIRHGDTNQADRQAMLEETPHILNTTPETLAILLNAPRFREKLRSVEYVIVDEIHSVAENKRGSHLSVSLERLEALAAGSPVRIGCSATVEPIERIADFLVGYQENGTVRERRIVDCRFMRDYDLTVHTPTADLIATADGTVRDHMYEQLHRWIQEYTNTIVFTNTRSGAERVLHELRERFDVYEPACSGCHHGSLSQQERQRVEEGLKAGTMDVVTTSTSLELGIDMPKVDLVVQLGSPKSVSALLQRIGRAGHRPGQTVAGRLVVLDRDELLECTTMVARAQEGFVDRVFIPERPLDVAIQHVFGIAIASVRCESTVRSILQGAYPFRDLTDEAWERVIRYLTADYAGLEDRNIYAKIWRDTNDPPDGEHHYPEFSVGTSLIGKRGRLARVIYLTNVGTIPDSFACEVFTRADQEWVGSLDEEYLDTLDPGDVFLLGGSRFEFRYRRGGHVYVDRTADRPTVPSWYSERMPLSYDLGCETLDFQEQLLEAHARGGADAVMEILADLPLNEASMGAIAQMVDEQITFIGPEGISTSDRVVIEVECDRAEYERRYYVHTRYGRHFNDGLSRLLADKCAQATDANVSVAVNDGGFCLSMPLNRKVDLPGLLRDIDPGAVRDALRTALEDTELLKRYFRINATRSLLILTRYKGYEKSAKEQQVSSEMLLSYVQELDDFAVLDETFRELLEDRLDVPAIETFLEAIHAGEIEISNVRVGTPSPFAFGLATLSASDVIVADDRSEVLQDFHRRVRAAIDEDETSGSETSPNLGTVSE